MNPDTEVIQASEGALRIAGKSTPNRSPRRAVGRTARVLIDLLFVLTARDIKIKYKQSLMGFLWAILMPTIIVGAGMLIRVAMSKISGMPLPTDSFASQAVKSLPWAFFISGMGDVYHTPADSMEKFSGAVMEKVSRLTYLAAFLLADK